ncbi:MAG: hypothetical protein JSR15_05095, partial [Proteobacteria bacterium]|nr:hypothetical protein [Pseudomonadota bacterium]
EFWYGTESRSGLEPLGVGGSMPRAMPAGGATAPTGSSGAASPADHAPVDVSTTGAASTVVGGSGGASAAPAGAPSPRIAALQGITEVPSGRPTESDGPTPHPTATLAGPTDIKVGDEFTVTLQLQTDQNIARVRSQVRFDAAAFQLTSGDAGGIIPSALEAKVTGRAGGAQLDVSANSDNTISGNGELMVLHFRALQPRAQTAFAAQVSVMGGSGAIMATTTPAPLTVSVTN